MLQLETEFSFQDSSFLFILLELGIGLRVGKIEEQKFRKGDEIIRRFCRLALVKKVELSNTQFQKLYLIFRRKYVYYVISLLQSNKHSIKHKAIYLIWAVWSNREKSNMAIYR